MIESELSKMPTYRAEAVRSRFGYPDPPNGTNSSETSGTTRQNVEKHDKEGPGRAQTQIHLGRLMTIRIVGLNAET